MVDRSTLTAEDFDDADQFMSSLLLRMEGVDRFCKLVEKASPLDPLVDNGIRRVLLKSHLNLAHLHRARALNIEYASWAARNLLELLVWAMFLTASEENARRFYDDRLVDVKGLLSALEKLVNTHSIDVSRNLAALSEHRTTLQVALSESAIGDKEKYLDTSAVAKGLGVEGTFSSLYKILSKLTHPTSFSVFLDPQFGDGDEVKLRFFILWIGMISCCDVFDITAEYYRRVGIDVSMIEDPTFKPEHTFRTADARRL